MTDYPKSILIHAKEWRDKAYGNTYFSARIYLDGELATILPFQYGYDGMALYTAMGVLASNGKMPKDTFGYGLKETYGIVLHYIKETNQKKRDVKAWGYSD